MNRPRIKIAHLLLLILASGAVMGALKTPTPLVASAVFTGMLLVLLAALACALRAKEPARRFWLGFALFGWGYAALSFGPGLDEAVGPYLVTRHLLDAAVRPQDNLKILRTRHARFYPLVGPASLEIDTTPPDQTHTTVSTSVTYRLDALARITRAARLSPSERKQFIRIGESLCVLGVALMGGLFTLFAFAPRSQTANEKQQHSLGGAP